LISAIIFGHGGIAAHSHEHAMIEAAWFRVAVASQALR
jgi:hypothetical protein